MRIHIKIYDNICIGIYNILLLFFRPLCINYCCVFIFKFNITQLSKCKSNGIDDDNDETSRVGLEEVKKFKDGPLVQSVISSVSTAMGLKQTLSYGEFK